MSSEALVTRADDLGYRVSDQELLAAMAQVPAFQVDGKFDQAHAVAVLKAQGRSIAEIEGMFRRDVKLRQLDTALSASSFATPTELKEFRALTRQQRELAWLDRGGREVCRRRRRPTMRPSRRITKRTSPTT